MSHSRSNVTYCCLHNLSLQFPYNCAGMALLFFLFITVIYAVCVCMYMCVCVCVQLGLVLRWGSFLKYLVVNHIVVNEYYLNGLN